MYFTTERKGLNKIVLTKTAFPKSCSTRLRGKYLLENKPDHNNCRISQGC